MRLEVIMTIVCSIVGSNKLKKCGRLEWKMPMKWGLVGDAREFLRDVCIAE